MGDMSTSGSAQHPGADGSLLTAAQERFWRQWLVLSARVPVALHRQLQDESGLSLQDFEVLVKLAEAAEGKLRVTELAKALTWERSRLSHHITRMTGRGLVDREECEDDGRGALVVVTEEGRAAMEQAAPAHVRTVRDLVFASLDEDQLAILSAFAGGVLERLSEGDGPNSEGDAAPS